MGDLAAKMAKKAGLEPGEVVAAAVRALPPGGIKQLSARAAGGAVGGLVGAAVATAMSNRGDKNGAAPVASFPMAKPMILGVTDRRIIVMNQTALMGSPKAVLGSVPLADIASCTTEEGKAVGMKNLHIMFTLRDGSSTHVEIARALMGKGRAFAVAVQQALGAPPPA